MKFFYVTWTLQLALKTRIFQTGLKSKTPFIAVYLHVMIYKLKPLLKENIIMFNFLGIQRNSELNCFKVLKMKRQENMEKIVLALSSALRTFLLLLQCYSVLALEIMRVWSQLRYIALEAVLSRNSAIARFKKMKSR